MNDAVMRRIRTITRLMQLGITSDDDPDRYNELYDKWYRLEEIAAEEKGHRQRLGELIGSAGIEERDRLNADLVALGKEKAKLEKAFPEVYPQDGVANESGVGLDVFKQMNDLLWGEISLTLVRVEGAIYPDRVKVSAREVTRTVSCTDFGLINMKGSKGFNELGETLEKLRLRKFNEVKPKPVSRLREKLRNNLGIKGDPFELKRESWKPKFKLLDAEELADDRAKKRTNHEGYDDNRVYSESDPSDGPANDYLTSYGMTK